MQQHVWLSMVIAPAGMAQEQPGASATPPGSTPVNVPGIPGGSPSAPAQPGTTSQPANLPPAAPARGPDMTFVWLMVGGMLVVMMLTSVFQGRGEKKRRAALMSAVGKGDKVLMMGGVIGTVAEMGDTDVVIRVEEGKIRYSKASIQQVLESRERAGS